MKRSALIVGGLALGITASPLLAQQVDTQRAGGFIDYFTTQLGISDVDGFDNGMILGIAAGKEFRALPGFAVEAEVTTTLTKPEAKIGDVSADVSYWTVGGYGVYALPLGETFAVRGRVGVLYQNVDVSSNVGGNELDDEVNVSLGVGGLMHLNPRLNVVAEYTRIEQDINHYTAGVQWKF